MVLHLDQYRKGPWTSVICLAFHHDSMVYMLYNNMLMWDVLIIDVFLITLTVANGLNRKDKIFVGLLGYHSLYVVEPDGSRCAGVVQELSGCL